MTNRQVLVESVVSMPILGPDGRVCKDFEFAGKTDRVENQRIKDYKGCVSPVKFIHELDMSFQAEMYAMALATMGYPIVEIEYLLCMRPTIRLKKNQTVSAYEDECVNWLLHKQGKEPKMVRHPVTITEGRMQKAMEFLYECGQEVSKNRQSGIWLHNKEACYNWNKSCTYIDLCRATSYNMPVGPMLAEGFRRGPAVHQELGNLESLGVLTHSSTCELTMCRLKYWWHYEQGIRRLGIGEDEPLWIGSAMHEGMAMVDHGQDAAFKAIDEFTKENPTIGKMRDKQQQNTARAKAMVRAITETWINKEENPSVS